jgi:RimJ/RimL family protein N-acetyltransferase
MYEEHPRFKHQLKSKTGRWDAISLFFASYGLHHVWRMSCFKKLNLGACRMFPDLTCDDIFQLETQRLWLRWPRAQDAQAMALLAGTPEVALRTARLPFPYTKTEAGHFILSARQANALGRELVLVLAPKQRPHDVMGVISLHASTSKKLLIGYWLGQPFWGKGFMREAAQALIDMSFRITSAELISAETLSDNQASLNLLTYLGFTQEGVFDTSTPQRGAISCARFQLMREKWAQHSLAPQIEPLSV